MLPTQGTETSQHVHSLPAQRGILFTPGLVSGVSIGDEICLLLLLSDNLIVLQSLLDKSPVPLVLILLPIDEQALKIFITHPMSEDGSTKDFLEQPPA